MPADPTRSGALEEPASRDVWEPLIFAARARRAWLIRAVFWIAGILIAIALLGFFAAPYLLRPVLERKLTAALDRSVTITRLDLNPFALSATLHDVSVAGRDTGPPLLAFDELYLDADSASLFRWAPVIKALKLTRPTLNVVRNADKSYNFSDLLDRALAGPPGPPPRFSVSNIEVADGSILFDDRPERQQHKIANLNLGVPFLSSLPSQVEINVEPKFSALVNGRPVRIDGVTHPFEDTRETLLHWDLDTLPLATYAEYIPAKLPIKIESGQLSAGLDLRFVEHGRDPSELTLAGTMRLAELSISDSAGAKLIRAPAVAVDIGQLDLIGNRADVRSVTADGIEIELRRGANGEFNFATLAPSDKSPPAAPSKPFHFHLGKLSVNHGVVHASDAAVTPEFATTLSDLTVALSNLDSAAAKPADVSFSFVTDRGAHFTHLGTLGLLPLRIDGRLEFAGMKFALLFPYYASALNLVVDDGTLDASTAYHFDGGTTPPSFTLSGLDAKATDLKLRLPDEKEPHWRVPTLAVHGGSIDVARHVIRFESIEGRGAAATFRRNASGQFNFARLVRASGHTDGEDGREDTWRVEEQKLNFDDFSATFTDETVTPAARIALSRLSVKAENLSNAPKSNARIAVRATVGKRGILSVSGPVTRPPLAATLDVVAKDIDLVPFQPYLSREARVVLTGGAVSAHGSLTVESSTATHAGFKGDVVLNDFVVLDDANDTDLLRWKTLALSRIDAQLEPLAVNIGNIALNDFFARLLLNERGEFNLQGLARSSAPVVTQSTPAPQVASDTKTAEVTTPPGTATTWLRLGKATLTSGSIDFTDHFIRPNYSANLTGVDGTFSTLAFDQPAEIELHGSVQGSAPVEITGRINPLAQNLLLDVKASATDIELAPLTPYSDKYIGYGITKGKLSMKVSYLVDNRKLTARNSIILDQLTFGDKVESPDAIKAPVLLAVSLLKDRNGVIQFDLPVSGTLDDPKFSVGGLVVRALVSLILKAATAPFALLGALAGSHGEELAFIEFPSGSAMLDQGGIAKCQTVAKALNDRPALKLDIAGRVDPAADREALTHAAVDRQVHLQKFNDLVRDGEAPSSVDAVPVSPTEYDALLTRAYKAAEIPDKPRNAFGLQKDLPRAGMEAILLANAKVSDDDLRALAQRRAGAVRAHLVDVEHVPADRVFVIAPHIDAQDIKDKGKTTRVDFALR